MDLTMDSEIVYGICRALVGGVAGLAGISALWSLFQELTA